LRQWLSLNGGCDNWIGEKTVSYAQP
jgi:hypothetical protein